MHPSAVGSSWNKTVGSTIDKSELSKETSQRHQPIADLKKDDIASGKEYGMVNNSLFDFVSYFYSLRSKLVILIKHIAFFILLMA